jgi:hypothetical protein
MTSRALATDGPKVGQPHRRNRAVPARGEEGGGIRNNPRKAARFARASRTVNGARPHWGIVGAPAYVTLRAR